MYLTADELKTTYGKKFANMDIDDLNTYLQRANTLAYGEIGGIPAGLTSEETAALKGAVALAFEIFANGESGQVDQETGTITEAAPEGVFVRKTYKESDPFAVVKGMLAPFAQKVAAAVLEPSRGVMFL